MTDGQVDIFYTLCFQPADRIQIETATQYGKSLTVALACLVITCIQDEVVAVVAPTTEKARLIMRYYIEHLGDDPIFEAQLEKNTRLERLRQEESKQRIILKDGGGIFIISAQAGNTRRGVEAAMGAGATKVFMDEAGLIPDNIEATIFRMISGKGSKACYVKIGNTFYSEEPYSHFYHSSLNPKYLQIFIDYKQALKEGRYTQAFIDEARTKPLFDVLYACVFPKQAEIDEKGYRRLISLEEIRSAFIPKVPDAEMLETKKVGADIGRGGNKNAFTLRTNKVLWIESMNQSKDLMVQADELQRITDDNTILDETQKTKKLIEAIFIDDTGVGGGVTDRAKQKGLYVTGIRTGDPAVGKNKEKFKNRKAENFWDFRQWIIEGGKLVESNHWLLLNEIKYRVDQSGKLVLEPKEEMVKRAISKLMALGSSSPDGIDSGSLTFNDPDKPKLEWVG